MGESLSAESAHFFEVVCGDLDAAGIPYDLNQRLVRGLDYYGHSAFELWHESLQGAQNALGGGGRYDGLVGRFRGEKQGLLRKRTLRIFLRENLELRLRVRKILLPVVGLRQFHPDI